MEENHQQFFLLAHPSSGLQLRGEFVVLPGDQTLLFLGSPWFTEAGEIAERGLGFEDFAIHEHARAHGFGLVDGDAGAAEVAVGEQGDLAGRGGLGKGRQHGDGG